MGDFLRECNAGKMKMDSKSFQQIWCVRCSRKDCVLAGFAREDPLAIRNATWRERFFNPEQADLRIPKFARISTMDFPNLLQKAMKLEISERRGDWSVPDVSHIIPDVPILDGVSRTVDEATNNHVDEAVRALAEATGKPPPGMFVDEEEFPVEMDDIQVGCPTLDYDGTEPPYPEETYEDEPPQGVQAPLPTPAPTFQKSQKPFQPSMRNVPDQGGIMLGGAPAPQSQGVPASEEDPWAPPTRPRDVVVKSGARIQFGTGGQGKVVDD